jgi:pimeloyl-ACP methyl ester carboxylesterase
MPQIEVAGRALEYQWVGESSETVLVLLHEGLGSIRQWRDFPEKLAAASGRRVLVYDRYGYGRSEVLKEEKAGVRFMHREALEVLPSLLHVLKIEHPVLVGHSDGASIAIIHAGSHPVRALALMAPHVFVEDFNLASIRKIADTFESSGLKAGLAKYHTDPVKTFHLWADAWLDPEFRKWNIEEFLPRIACPVLAIQGEDDQYGTMAQLEAIERQVAGPCELLKLEKCGHSPFRDQPERVLESIVKFMKNV